MKKVLFLSLIAITSVLSSCETQKQEEVTTESVDTTQVVDTTSVDTTAVAKDTIVK